MRYPVKCPKCGLEDTLEVQFEGGKTNAGKFKQSDIGTTLICQDCKGSHTLTFYPTPEPRPSETTWDEMYNPCCLKPWDELTL